jgi:hypothetical protein
MEKYQAMNKWEDMYFDLTDYKDSMSDIYASAYKAMPGLYKPADLFIFIGQASDSILFNIRAGIKESYHGK